MNLIKYNDPFTSLSNFHTQIDDIFANFFNDKSFKGISPLEPKMDIYSEDDKSLIFDVHVPNFQKDSLEVDVKDHILSIKGQKTDKDEQDKKKSYYLRESTSSFFRSVALPKNIDTESITAKYENGLLKIKFDFKPDSTPKKVEIS